MEGMKVNEQESRLFNELFNFCDTDNSGKVFGQKASELFMTSGLSTDLLHQVIELCGAKRLGHFGRSQFFVALKLIAVAQAGFPLTQETFMQGRDVPLPKFDIKSFSQLQHRGSGGGQLPPPPKASYSSAKGGRINQYFEVHQADQKSLSAYDAPQSPPVSPMSTNPSSALAHYPTATQQPNTTAAQNMVVSSQVPLLNQQCVVNQMQSTPNTMPLHHPQVIPSSNYNNYDTQILNQQPSKLEKGWASFENDDDNQGLLSEQRKEWAHFTDSSKADTSSVSSETDSMTDDVWHVTEEQREYYVNQFKTMQPDITGLISGGIAKEFFEKSRLPIAELSKIWQLSDVNKDGALNLEEFCTAMHLVVLRRNEIELPNHLPPSLVPYVPFSNPDEQFAATDLPKFSAINKVDSPVVLTQQQWINNFGHVVPESPASSSVSSPGHKPTPVNFDFKPIGVNEESDIVHPVALRMSPDHPQQHMAQQPQEPGGYNSQDLSPNDHISAGTRGSVTQFIQPLVDIRGESVQSSGVPLHTRARPVPVKSQSVPAPQYQQQQRESLTTNQPILAPSSHAVDTHMSSTQPRPHHPTSSQPHSGAVTMTTSAADENVPVPPPRKSHSRSGSLDANHLLDISGSAPPLVPPRPKEGSSLITSDSLPIDGSLSSSHMKKLTPEHSGQDEVDATKTKPLSKQFSQEKKELLLQIKKQKEKNETLSRLNSELNQELQEAMEQRIALEIQMEHLRPYGGSYLYS